MGISCHHWPCFRFSFASPLFPRKKFSSNTWFCTIGGDPPGRYTVWKNTDCQWWHPSWRWLPNEHSSWSCTWVSDTKWYVCSVCTTLIKALFGSVLLTFQTVGYVSFEQWRPQRGRAGTQNYVECEGCNLFLPLSSSKEEYLMVPMQEF